LMTVMMFERRLLSSFAVFPVDDALGIVANFCCSSGMQSSGNPSPQQKRDVM